MLRACVMLVHSQPKVLSVLVNESLTMFEQVPDTFVVDWTLAVRDNRRLTISVINTYYPLFVVHSRKYMDVQCIVSGFGILLMSLVPFPKVNGAWLLFQVKFTRMEINLFATAIKLAAEASLIVSIYTNIIIKRRYLTVCLY